MDKPSIEAIRQWWAEYEAKSDDQIVGVTVGETVRLAEAVPHLLAALADAQQRAEAAEQDRNRYYAEWNAREARIERLEQACYRRAKQAESAEREREAARDALEGDYRHNLFVQQSYVLTLAQMEYQRDEALKRAEAAERQLAQPVPLPPEPAVPPDVQ